MPFKRHKTMSNVFNYDHNIMLHYAMEISKGDYYNTKPKCKMKRIWNFKIFNHTLLELEGNFIELILCFKSVAKEFKVMGYDPLI